MNCFGVVIVVLVMLDGPLDRVLKRGERLVMMSGHGVREWIAERVGVVGRRTFKKL